MKYYLSENEFKRIWWDKGLYDITQIERRIGYWLDNMESSTNLSYDEILSYSPSEPGFWGWLEGEEKQIIWFLLQL